MPAKPILPDSEAVQRAAKAIRGHGGMIRMADALRAGIHRNTLRAMVESGKLERVTRGLYRLQDAPGLGHPDLVTVARKVPQGVLCLISALSYHEMTTQIPHEIYVAIARNCEPPRLDYPPLRVFRFSGEAFTAGVEKVRLDGTDVRLYDPEKTLADCFKYRNKLGMDTVLEALRFYRERRKPKVAALLRYAKVCRVESVMRPYLEAIL
jgi:predicted transcriptional regulator of viral defense system